MSDQQQRDKVVSGPIVRTILSLALPVTAGMLMEVALSVTDFYWVGRLGPAAQDAVTSSMVIIWTIFSAISIITIGVTALVSRYVGSKDLDNVRFYIRQAIWLTVGISGALTLAGYLLTPAAMDFMDAGGPTRAHAIPYLRVFFLSCVFFMMNETIFAIFRASGDTNTPMRIGIAIVLINMVLDPLLIFGWGPIPAFGVTGASLASALAVVGGTVAVFKAFYGNRLDYDVGPIFSVKPAIKPMLKISRIGLPIASQQFVFVAVYWFLIKYVHEFGEAAGAAMGIGNRMESVSYLTCYGFSIAASTMVGQNLGAERPDRAAKCAWGSIGLGIVVTLFFSVFFIATPELLAGVFTDDPRVKEIAVDYLIILGISQFAMAVEIILEGAFSGAGDTIPPMVVMIPGAISRIPLAWYLAFELDWGVNGIWWTLTITCMAKAAVLAWWFGLGHWKKREL